MEYISSFRNEAVSLTYKRNLLEQDCALNARILTKRDEGHFTVCVANRGCCGVGGRLVAIYLKTTDVHSIYNLFPIVS